MRNVKNGFLHRHVLDRTKMNDFKQKKSRFVLAIMKEFFTVRLPSKVVDVPSSEEFKASKFNTFSPKPNFSDILLNDKEEKV